MWFEVKVSYSGVDDRGAHKTLKEVYLVDAVSCTDAEARMMQELDGAKELSVLSVKASKVDVLNPSIEGVIYRAKVVTVALDERTGEEKHKTAVHVLPALCISEALVRFNALDYADDVVSVERTNIKGIIQ